MPSGIGFDRAKCRKRKESLGPAAGGVWEPRNDCDVGGETPKQTAEVAMPKPSPRQRKTMGRVMHEFKHGELKSGPGGKAGKVRSRRQAIAIALKEAGASNTRASARTGATSPSPSARRRAATPYQQEREGKSHVGARGRRESSAAMGGKNATRTTREGARPRARARSGDATKEQLYRRAKARDIPGRSKMSKRQLENALQ